MADITMCRGVGCPAKHRCYRALAGPGVQQSWADYDKLRDDANPCAFYWDVSEDDAPADNGFMLDERRDPEWRN